MQKIFEQVCVHTGMQKQALLWYVLTRHMVIHARSHISETTNKEPEMTTKH